MPIPEIAIDILRGLHLLCFAAGMGTSLYFDQRTLRNINSIQTHDDVESLHAFHLWITAAFGGLWITGLALIYVRTGFVFADFSPKLWLKVSIMTLMVANAIAVSHIVIPTMQARVGQTMLGMPTKKLAIVTQIAVNSVFCWTAGVALGSSTVLKTAPWEVLLPLAALGFAVMTIGGQGIVWLVRRHVYGTGEFGQLRGQRQLELPLV